MIMRNQLFNTRPASFTLRLEVSLDGEREFKDVGLELTLFLFFPLQISSSSTSSLRLTLSLKDPSTTLVSKLQKTLSTLSSSQSTLRPVSSGRRRRSGSFLVLSTSLPSHQI